MCVCVCAKQKKNISGRGQRTILRGICEHRERLEGTERSDLQTIFCTTAEPNTNAPKQDGTALSELNIFQSDGCLFSMGKNSC